jgi:hypothetical protein
MKKLFKKDNDFRSTTKYVRVYNYQDFTYLLK